MNQQTAQGLASLGRGSDSMLVHMAPEEVAGLQALALKHGGTLTINPETGLAEAGFLKNILPMVAGFALGPAGFGLMSSAMAGLTVGGITALTSKSLEKGLMAGLGAYGGSELGVGFSNAAPAPEALAPATSPAVAQAPNVAAIGSSGPPTLANAATGPASGFNPAFDPTVSRFVTPATPSAFPATITQPPPVNIGPTPVSFDRAVSGFKAVTDSPGAALAFAKDNVMPLTALGIAALSGSDDKKAAMSNDPGMIRPYTYARTKVPGVFDRIENDPMSSKERRYFNEQYTALTPYKAPGPEYMAVGGPVEDMSNGNNMAAYMGQDKFAEGGSVGGYIFDPKTGLYSKPGGEGATTVSPTGRTSGASGDSGGSGGNMQPLSQQTIDFLDKEAATPGARDVRMGQVSKAIEGLIGFAVPGMGLVNMARDGTLTTLAGGIANFFDPPGAVNYGIPVDEKGTYVGVPGEFAAMNDVSFDQDAANNAQVGASEQSAANEAAGPSGAGTADGGDGYARGGLSALAQGGITGSGNLDLSIPIDIGGGGGGSSGGSYGGGGSYPFTSIGGQGSNPQQTFGSSNNPQPFIGNNNARSMMPQQGVTFLPDPTLDPKIRQFPTDMESVRQSMMKTRGLPPGVMFAGGGIANLGDYSDGGRLLRGPGDGISDSIPAMIGQKQQARLADGEFVVPARIVSELGNGSTEAGARQLYAMMDRVQKARKKTVGKDKVATNSRAARLLPA